MTLLQGLYRFEKAFGPTLGYTSSDLKEVYEIVELDWRGVKF